MALSVDKVFRFVQFVSNKESRGWVSPEEFNIAAELAQIAVYSRLESYFLSNKKILSDMRPFLKQSSLTMASAKYSFPSDFRQLLSALSTAGKEIKELTQAEYPAAANSAIIAPTTSHPALVMRDDGIYVYPTTYTDPITVEYIADLSTTPTWAYTTTSGRPVYDSGNSIDFEFEDNLFLEIAMNVLANVGMNIGKEDITQYGMLFNSEK